MAWSDCRNFVLLEINLLWLRITWPCYFKSIPLFYQMHQFSKQLFFFCTNFRTYERMYKSHPFSSKNHNRFVSSPCPCTLSIQMRSVFSLCFYFILFIIIACRQTHTLPASSRNQTHALVGEWDVIISCIR